MMIEREPAKLRLGSLLFTWDDEKEKKNRKKHGIDFTFAATVFLDDDAVINFNSVDEFTGEKRFDVTGMPLPVTVFVVYVERITVDNKEIIRIISARRANRKERERYVNGS